MRNMKKFEEGVFSDLRNLKPGTDACLEEPKVRSLRLFSLPILSSRLSTRLSTLSCTRDSLLSPIPALLESEWTVDHLPAGLPLSMPLSVWVCA